MDFSLKISKNSTLSFPQQAALRLESCVSERPLQSSKTFWKKVASLIFFYTYVIRLKQVKTFILQERLWYFTNCILKSVCTALCSLQSESIRSMAFVHSLSYSSLNISDSFVGRYGSLRSDMAGLFCRNLSPAAWLSLDIQ